MDNTKYLYRYERGFSTYPTYINLHRHPIVKETEKGYWILSYGFHSGKRWVSKTARKRWAYPTEEEAYTNFRLRTERCVKILNAQLENAKAYLKAERRELTPNELV